MSIPFNFNQSPYARRPDNTETGYDEHSFTTKTSTFDNSYIENNKIPGVNKRRNYVIPKNAQHKDCGVIRTTHRFFPSSKSVKQNADIEFSLLLNWDAIPSDEVPVQNRGVTTVVRCLGKNCRAYISPFNKFVSYNKYICIFCGIENNIPQKTADSLKSARNTAIDSIGPTFLEVESCYYELIAPEQYYIDGKPYGPVCYTLLIEVSNSYSSQVMLKMLSKTLPNFLMDLAAKNENTKVCFIAYDSFIHFVKVPSNGVIQVEVSSDLKNVCVPVREEIMLELETHLSVFCEFFQNLYENYSRNSSSDSALGTAISTAQKLAGESSMDATKLLVFNSTPCNMGEGPMSIKSLQEIARRFEKAKMKDKKESTWDPETFLLQDSSAHYTEKAIELERTNTSVDFFFFHASGKFFDAGSINALTRYTGGKLHLYEVPSPPLHIADDRSAAYRHTELQRILTALEGDMALSAKDVYTSAMMRFRKSDSLDIVPNSFIGSVVIRNGNLVCVPSIARGANIAVSIDFSENEKKQNIVSNFVFFQSAVLYTNRNRERRIRVCTIAVPTTNSAQTLIKETDLEVYNAILLKKSVELCVSQTFKIAREYFNRTGSKFLKQLKNIEKNRMTETPSKQNYINPLHNLSPEIRYFSLFVIGTLKSVAITPLNRKIDNEEELYKSRHERKDLSLSERLVSNNFIRSVGVDECAIFSQPIIFSLLDALMSEDFDAQLNSGNYVLGEDGKLYEALEQKLANLDFLDRVVDNCRLPLNEMAKSYPLIVIFNSLEIVIRVSRNCDKQTLFALFGLESLPLEIDDIQFSKVEDDSPFAIYHVKINLLLSFLASKVSRMTVVPRVKIESKDTDEYVFRFLIEETTDHVMCLEKYIHSLF